MIAIIKKAQKNGDTVGGEFRVLISGVPYGLGSYISWNKKLNLEFSLRKVKDFCLQTIIYIMDLVCV